MAERRRSVGNDAPDGDSGDLNGARILIVKTARRNHYSFSGKIASETSRCS